MKDVFKKILAVYAYILLTIVMIVFLKIPIVVWGCITIFVGYEAAKHNFYDF